MLPKLRKNRLEAFTFGFAGVYISSMKINFSNKAYWQFIDK